MPAEALAAGMIAEEAAQGRGQVFDNVLRQQAAGTKRWWPPACAPTASTTRTQRYPDAERCLTRFAHLPLYIVTDGHKEVQARKVAALGLAGRVRHAYLTNRYGRHRAKPDPHVFQLICRREGVPPEQVTYVGDNVKKTLWASSRWGLKRCGFCGGTMRTMRPMRPTRLTEDCVA